MRSISQPEHCCSNTALKLPFAASCVCRVLATIVQQHAASSSCSSRPATLCGCSGWNLPEHIGRLEVHGRLRTTETHDLPLDLSRAVVQRVLHHLCGVLRDQLGVGNGDVLVAGGASAQERAGEICHLCGVSFSLQCLPADTLLRGRTRPLLRLLRRLLDADPKLKAAGCVGCAECVAPLCGLHV